MFKFPKRDFLERPERFVGSMKKLIAISFILIFGIYISISLLPDIITIVKLKNGYLKITNVDEKVDYTLTDYKSDEWVDLSSLDKKFYMALVVSEDWDYFNHYGIDFRQIKDALWSHFLHGKKLRGASTITQQMVKNLFLSNERSFIRKFKEAGLSLFADAYLSKEKILEVYLNIIEYGPQLYGVVAASKHYFNAEPDVLFAKEGAFLAMLLPNPKRNSQSFRSRSLTEYGGRAIVDILHKLKTIKILSEFELEAELTRLFDWEDYISIRWSAADNNSLAPSLPPLKVDFR